MRLTGRQLCALSSALFVPSWFVTAAHTRGELVGGRSAGWQAFTFAISPLAGNDMGAGWPLLAWMVSSALTNVLLVLLFVFVSWRPQVVSRRLVGALAVATMINAYWFLLPDMRDDLRIGYYLWLAAFALGAVAAWATVRERSDATAQLNLERS